MVVDDLPAGGASSGTFVRFVKVSLAMNFNFALTMKSGRIIKQNQRSGRNPGLKIERDSTAWLTPSL